MTEMARLPLPRFAGRIGLQSAVGADGAQSVPDDIVDMHLLSGRLPGRFASYRSLLRRLLVGRTARPEIVLSDAELASFTRAAEHLGLSKARVSTAVRSLEDSVGSRLLQRSTRAVRRKATTGMAF